MLDTLPGSCWTNAFNGPADVIQQQLDACLPIYEQALIAAQYENVDWQPEIRDGSQVHNHLGSLYRLMHITLVVGRYRLERGAVSGFNAWCAAWMMGRHAAQGGECLSYLRQVGIHKAMLDMLTATKLGISSSSLASTADALAALPDAWPLADSIRCEKRLKEGYLLTVYKSLGYARFVQQWDQPERGDTEMSQQVGDKTQKEKDAFVQRLEEELVAYHNRGLQVAALPAIEQMQAIDKALAEAPRFTKLGVGAYPSAVSRGLMEAYIETAIRPLILAACRAVATPKGTPLLVPAG
jgi:hypothetical protein